MPTERRKGSGKFLKVIGAAENNLRHIDVTFPLGTFTVRHRRLRLRQVLSCQRGALQAAGGRPDADEGPARQVRERSRASSTWTRWWTSTRAPSAERPASNPATYTGLFNDIRDLFASTQEAKSRGYGPGRFSFNVRGGRCEACSGRRRAENRDALPAGHLRPLRGLQRQAVQPGDPGGPLQGQEHLPTCWT